MWSEIILFLTGMALFLIGLVRLGETVRQLLTARIREYIRYAVGRQLSGLLVGLTTTILLQSSTASTVITVGIVSAGLISFYHSLGILLGADIGTTVTVQLVVWKVTALSPAFIVAGSIFWLSGKEKGKRAGELLFYFGLMFFGLEMTGQAAAPLKEQGAGILLRQAANPLIGFGVGLAITALIHASSVPISILAVMAQQDLVTIETALPIVFGANIGTTVTVLLAGLTAGISGRRTAAAHFFFKLAGVGLVLPFFPLFIALLKTISANTAQQIALGHFFLNVFIAAAFLPVLGPVARLIERIIPGRESIIALWPEYLDPRLITDPENALKSVRMEMTRMIRLARKMSDEAMEAAETYDSGKCRNVLYLEPALDNLRTEIVNYLWKLSCRELSAENSKKLFSYTAMADDIERIGDHSVNLVELAHQKHRRDIQFSVMGMMELHEIRLLVARNMEDAEKLVDAWGEEAIVMISDREKEIDRIVRQAREKHLERFHRRICQAEAGPIFIEMLVNLERISDHCENIAEYMHEIRAEGVVSSGL
ncbi:MAG: Na/Pi cotransporter family protein [Syntrophales bacterium]